MPYSSPDDPSLPADVKRLAPQKRRQFVAVWNATFKNCRNPKTPGGRGSVDDCETRAFKFAYAAIGTTKEMGMPETASVGTAAPVAVQCGCGQFSEVAQGAKEFACDSCKATNAVTWKDYPPDEAVEVVEFHRPFGGATTFDEVEQYQEAGEQRTHICQLKYVFDEIWRNIWDDPSDEVTIEERAALTRQAVTDLVARIEAGPEAMKDDGLLARIKRSLFGEGEKAETKREDGKDFGPGDYADMPDAGKPTMWKLRLGGTPGSVDATHVAAAITAMQPGGFRGNVAKLGSDKAKVTARINAAIGKLTATDARKTALRERLAKVKEGGDEEEGSAFFVTKGIDGQPRWLAVVTNRFEDGDGEVFSEASHREFERYLDETKDYPELLVWHTPGTRLGKADFWTYADGFVISSGSFDAGVKAEVQRLAEYPEPMGVSHGYWYDPQHDLKNGVYSKYRTREISALPRRRCANPWTAFGVAFSQEVKEMGFDPQKRGALVSIFGEGRVTEIEGQVAALSGALKAGGISFKELGDVLEHDGDGDDGQVADSAASGNGDATQAPAATAPTGVPAGDAGDAGADDPAAPAGPADASGGDTGQGDVAADEPIKAMVAAAAKEIGDAIDARLQPLEARVEELGKSLDQRVADVLRPKAVPDNGAIRPTDAAGNVVKADDAAAMVGDDTGGDKPVNPARKYVDMVAQGHVAT